MTILRATIVAAALAARCCRAAGARRRDGGRQQAPLPHAVWTEVKWPFPLDQWGTGKAFHCRAADCGTEINLYLRAKLGFCNCATGVSDDDELDRVGDLELYSDKFKGLSEGRFITVGWMKGRSRPYQVDMRYGAPRTALAIAFNDKCDVVVATVAADRDADRQRRSRGARFPQQRPRAALGRGGTGAVMKSAVVVFPGINRERDMARALKIISGREPAMVWHADTALPAGTDLVVVPGGFSYGDYLRCGAIAARAPVMDAVRAHAAAGGLVLGVCNGFQILCESGLLARRADAQRGTEIHLPRCLSAGRALRHAVHPRLQCRAGDPRAGRARRRELRGG